MNSKVLMLSIAVIAVGLFALPSTLSMFAGQHSWYDPKVSGGIPCQKCHTLERDELSASGGPHDVGYNVLVNTTMDYGNGNGSGGGDKFWGGTNSIDSRCYGCHQRAGSNVSHPFLNGSWDTDRNEKHAAIAVWCIDCHPWVETELTHDEAAHRWFYENLNETGEPTELGLQKPNRACLGCHTHVGVNITWTRNEFVSYNVDCNKSSYNVSWNQTDPLGTNTTRFNSSSGWQW